MVNQSEIYDYHTNWFFCEKGSELDEEKNKRWGGGYCV